MIVLNEAEFIEYTIRQLYHWDLCHEIIIVEGAVKDYPGRNVSQEGLSTDGTSQIIANFPDPMGKIQLIQGKWHNKVHQRNQYAERATGDYILVVDGDEFYRRKDLKRMMIEIRKHPQAYSFLYPQIHFWYDFYHIVKGGYWRIPHHRLWKWDRSFRYRENHNVPCFPDGRELWHTQKCRIPIRFYHTGFVKCCENMRDKQDFYYNRGERVTRPMYSDCREAWFNWRPGDKLPHGAKVKWYLGPIPEVLLDHPLKKRDEELIRSDYPLAYRFKAWIQRLADRGRKI